MEHTRNRGELNLTNDTWEAKVNIRKHDRGLTK